MKCRVNDACIGCGMCEGTCPSVFELVNGVATVKPEFADEIPSDFEQDVRDAADGCPVQAIEVED